VDYLYATTRQLMTENGRLLRRLHACAANQSDRECFAPAAACESQRQDMREATVQIAAWMMPTVKLSTGRWSTSRLVLAR
jgi:hypothetical protein